MLNKSLVIAALTTTTSAAAAAAPAKAAPAKAAPAAAAPAKSVITREEWEDVLGRDLCDDYGTATWEKWSKEQKKQNLAAAALGTEITANAAALKTLQDAYDKAEAAVNGQAKQDAKAAVALVLNENGSVKTMDAAAKLAKTAQVGISKNGTKTGRLDLLAAQKKEVDDFVTEVPKLYASAKIAAVTNTAPGLYTTLKGLSVTGNQKDLGTEVTTVLSKAALLDTAYTNYANKEADAAALVAMGDGTATLADSVARNAAQKVPQDAYNKAITDAEQITADKAMYKELTEEVSYLFRVVNRIKTGIYDMDKCEKGTAAAPMCTKKETAFDNAAGTSTWKWNPSGVNAVDHCNTTNSENCGMRALRTQTGRTTGTTGFYGTGLIDELDAVIGGATQLPGYAANTSELTVDANTQFSDWQTKVVDARDKFAMLIDHMAMAAVLGNSCWKQGGTTANTNKFQAADYYTGCTPVTIKNDNTIENDKVVWTTTNAIKWHPLLQEFTHDQRSSDEFQKANMSYWVEKAIAQTTIFNTAHKKVEADAGPVDHNAVHVTAQLKLWYAMWMRKALRAEEMYVAGLKATADAKTAPAYAANSTLDTNRRADAFYAWATWSGAVKTAAQLATDKAAITTTELANLNTAMTALKTLTDQGHTKIKAASDNWLNARTLYDTNLTNQKKALDAQADFGTNNANLTGSSTNAVAVATLNQTAIGLAVTAMQKQEAYLKGVRDRALRALTPALTAQNKRINDQRAALMKEQNAKYNVSLARKGCEFEAVADAQKKHDARVAAKAKVDAAKAKIRTDYDNKAKMPAQATTAVAKGGLCAINATTKVRPTCAVVKDAPLCCGAAQRFLKDGTKLVVESCQLKTDTTYTYYPVMAAGAVKAPTPETWRFQCISAAQKLAAAATAALAAGYMMA